MDLKHNISVRHLAIAVLSAAALSGCTRDSIDAPAPPAADGSIAFSPVGDAAAPTRAAAVTKDDIDDFAVTAFYNKGTDDLADALAFNNQKVTKAGDGWTYAPAQYWPGDPGLKIRFFALSPYSSSYAPFSVNYATGTDGATTTDANGNKLLASLSIPYTVPQKIAAQQDLLYAVTAPLNNAFDYADDGTATSATSPAAVPLTFKHATAQISFKVRMADGVAESYTAMIKSVKLYAFYTGSLVLYPNKTCSWSMVRDSETGNAVIRHPFTLIPGDGLQDRNGKIDGSVPTFNIATVEKTGTLAAKAAPFENAILLSQTNNFLFMLPQQPPVVELYRPSQLLMPVLNIEYRLDNGLTGDERLYTDKSVSFSLTDLHLEKEDRKYSELTPLTEGSTDTPDWPWIWEPGKAYCYTITISTSDATLNILPTDWIDGNKGNDEYEFK